VAAAVLDLPPHPEFAAKAGRALDLYARVFEGKRLARMST
jgi:hypothetical protein